MSRGCSLVGGTSSLAAATAATMAWCSSRGSVSGHSLRVNMNDLYSGLFRLRDQLSREVFSRDKLSRDVLSRLSFSSNPPLLLLQAIRCTHPTCPCECFAPGKQSLRYCDTCNHGWVAHGKYLTFSLESFRFPHSNLCCIFIIIVVDIIIIISIVLCSCFVLLFFFVSSLKTVSCFF